MVLADAPELAALLQAVGDDGVDDQVFLVSRFQRLVEPVAQPPGLRRRHLEEHVPGIGLRQRIAAAGVAEREIDGDARHQLERRQRAIGRLLDEGEEVEGVLRRRHRHERGLDRARTRKEFEHRRRDDAERALGADEQVAQVVAGVVLLELVEDVHHPAVGEHDFEPEHQVTGDPVGKGASAARIGGQDAADGAAAFGAERQREETIGLGWPLPARSRV